MTLTGTSTPVQSGPGSNGNESTPLSPDLQNESFTIRWRLMSYPEPHIFLGGFTTQQLIQSMYSKPLWYVCFKTYDITVTHTQKKMVRGSSMAEEHGPIWSGAAQAVSISPNKNSNVLKSEIQDDTSIIKGQQSKQSSPPR